MIFSITIHRTMTFHITTINKVTVIITTFSIPKLTTYCIMTLSKTTFSMTTLSIMRFFIMTLSIMSLITNCIMTLSKTTFSMT
jgi:hypothetical protein